MATISINWIADTPILFGRQRAINFVPIFKDMRSLKKLVRIKHMFDVDSHKAIIVVSGPYTNSSIDICDIFTFQKTAYIYIFFFYKLLAYITVRNANIFIRPTYFTSIFSNI